MKEKIEQLAWQADGLIPAIVQDLATRQVLMLAYVNQEALEKTLETGETWFYSRSRQSLWNKGASSGNRQKVKEIRYDCDQDALLIQVEPLGPACHTGEVSCFYETLLTPDQQADQTPILEKLREIIADRAKNPAEGSYTTYLFTEGIDKILKKIGEEAGEIIIAAKNDDEDELIWEIADFIYHSLVLMELKGIGFEQIEGELRKRFGTASEEEKT